MIRCHHNHRAAIAVVASAAAAFLSHAPSMSSSSTVEEDRTISCDNDNSTHHTSKFRQQLWHGSSAALLTSRSLHPSPRFASVAKCDATENKIYTFPRDLTDNDGSVVDHYYTKMEPSDLDRTHRDSHAIFGALWGKGLIERYNVYRRVESTQQQQKNKNSPSHKRELTMVDLKLGSRLNGHGGVAHGGIISLLIDEAMGWAYESLQEEHEKKNAASSSAAVMAVTANLTVDFRSPLMEESDAVIRVYHDDTKGRKIYFSAILESNDGNVVFAEAKSLFIRVRPDQLKAKL